MSLYLIRDIKCCPVRVVGKNKTNLKWRIENVKSTHQLKIKLKLQMSSGSLDCFALCLLVFALLEPDMFGWKQSRLSSDTFNVWRWANLEKCGNHSEAKRGIFGPWFHLKMKSFRFLNDCRLFYSVPLFISFNRNCIYCGVDMQYCAKVLSHLSFIYFQENFCSVLCQHDPTQLQ